MIACWQGRFLSTGAITNRDIASENHLRRTQLVHGSMALSTTTQLARSRANLRARFVLSPSRTRPHQIPWPIHIPQTPRFLLACSTARPPLERPSLFFTIPSIIIIRRLPKGQIRPSVRFRPAVLNGVRRKAMPRASRSAHTPPIPLRSFDRRCLVPVPPRVCRRRCEHAVPPFF